MAKSKSATSILKNLVSFFLSLFGYKRRKTRRVGSFGRPKYESKEARAFEKAPVRFTNTPKTSVILPLTKSVMDYYKFSAGEKYVLPAATLATSLIYDLYSASLADVFAATINEEQSVKIIKEDLSRLLETYGGMDIVYCGYNHAPPYRIKMRVLPRGYNCGLTNEQVGMPLRMFLLWYKGGLDIPANILQEWSGIPFGHFEDAYQSALEIFRCWLHEHDRMQLLTGRRYKNERQNAR